MKPYIDSTKFLKLILVFVSAILFPSLSHAVNKTIQIKSDISKTGLLSYSGTYSWQTGDFFVGDDASKKGGKGLLLFNLSAIPRDVTIVKVELRLASELKLDSNFGGQIRLLLLSDLDDLKLDETSWQNLNNGTLLGNISIEEGKVFGITGNAYNNMVKNTVGEKIGISLIHNTIGKIVRFWQKNCWLEVTYSENSGSSEAKEGDVNESFPLLSVDGIEVTSNSCILKWNEPTSGITGFQVANTNQDIIYSRQYRTPLILSYAATNLEGDSCYTFYVRYMKSVYTPSGPTVAVSNFSRWNKVQVITLPSKKLESPRNVKIEEINYGCIISWEAPADKTHWPIEYMIYQERYNPVNNSWITVNSYNVGNSLRYQVDNLSVGTTYRYSIMGKNQAGEGVANSISVTPKAPPTPVDEFFLFRPYKNRHVMRWEYSSSDIDSFIVERRTPFPKKMILGKTERGVDMGESAAASQYIYSIRAYKGRQFSNIVQCDFIEPPVKPINFRSTLDTNNHRILEWEYPVPNTIMSFVIVQHSPFSKRYNVDKDVRSFDIGETLSEYVYEYTIQASFRGVYSDEIAISFRGDSGPPTSPTNFRVLQPFGSIRVLLWDYPLTADIDDFVITQQSPSKQIFIVGKTSRGFEVGETRQNSTYIYDIQARKENEHSKIVTLGFAGGSASATRSINEEHNGLEDNKVSVTYASHTLYIQGIPIYALQVYEVSSGKLVMNLTNQNSDKVSLSTLEKGVYIVNVIYNEEIVTRKIVR